MKKVLAILTSEVMYGKERSNIEVYELLKERTNCHFSVIINRKANSKLKESVKFLNPFAIVSPNRHSTKHRLFTFLRTFIIGNLQTLYYIIKYKPDVLMMCNEITFYDLYPALYFYRKRIIYRIGDEPAFKNLSFRKYNEFVWNRYVLQKVTRCVCISQYIMNAMRNAGRKDENDVVIYNYPPARKQIGKDESNYYLASKGCNNVVFGFIGQIIEQKGVHHFIECALKILALYPNSFFYIAGGLAYMPTYAQQIQNMIPSKFKSNIILLGEIEDIETFFKHIDVLCVPSIKQEPLGNVLVEAKKYSRPCIIYPTGGMPELIRHCIDGYVCKAASSEALFEGIKYYVGNKELAIRHGIASNASIKELGIDRKSFEDKWMTIFKNIL